MTTLQSKTDFPVAVAIRMLQLGLRLDLPGSTPLYIEARAQLQAYLNVLEDFKADKSSNFSTNASYMVGTAEHFILHHKLVHPDTEIAARLLEYVHFYDANGK